MTYWRDRGGKQVAMFVLVVVLAAFADSCSKPAAADAPGVGQQVAPVVAAARAIRADLAHVEVLTAEFRPFQEVDVMAKVSGYVKNIRVDVGDRVRAGELLATLEIPEMQDDLTRAKAGVQRSTSEVAKAEDEVRRAESAHTMAHLSFERLKGVMNAKPGLIAQQELDDAQSRDLVAEAQIAAAKSNLAAAEEQVSVVKADQSRARTLFEYTRVIAPFDGVVTKRFADTGSMIQAGTASQTQAMPLVRISQNSLLRLTLPVPESAVSAVRVGQQVEVRVPTLGRSFSGKVARFAEKLDLATRTMPTEVDVPNAGLVLIPGMYAEVDLTLEQARGALNIPLTALEATGDQAIEAGANSPSSRVMLVTPDNRLEAREVSVGLETADRAEIRSGLNEGDVVVTGSRAGLRAGQTVTPKVVQMSPAKQD